jgi:hypothetical protein
MNTMDTMLQNTLFDFARGIREGGQEVAPIAFLVVPNALIQVHLMAMPKDQWRAAILDGISQTRARAVILHTEGWVVGGAQAPAALAAKMAGLGSLKDFPGRLEILQSAMETVDGSTRTLIASISSEGKLGATEVHEVAPVLGEMVGFFRRG